MVALDRRQYRRGVEGGGEGRDRPSISGSSITSNSAVPTLFLTILMHTYVLQALCTAGLSAEADAIVGEGGPSASGSSATSNGGGKAAGGGHSISAFKAACVGVLREYFDSSDAEEVGRRCADDMNRFLYVFV